MPELGAILTAIITPFDAGGRVDEDAFVAVQQHVCATGSDGVDVGSPEMCQGITDFGGQLTGFGHVAVLQLLRQRFENGGVSARRFEQSFELGDFLLKIRTLPRHFVLDLIRLMREPFAEMSNVELPVSILLGTGGVWFG